MLEAATQFAENHQAVLWAAGIASIVVFFASLLIMPALVIRIPVDYFSHSRRPASRFAGLHPAARLTLHIGKNALGGLLLMAGVAMLVLPGQGLLTILVGFLLFDFPRKYHLERWLVRKRMVHGPINWLRRRHRREPLRFAACGSRQGDIMQAINLADKLSRFHDTWSPRIIAELNGQQVKLAKLKGEFVWHTHEDEDELFYVIEGELIMQLRDGDVTLRSGDVFVVPRGVEHSPYAPNGAAVMLFEPAGTKHTGAVEHELTKHEQPWI